MTVDTSVFQTTCENDVFFSAAYKKKSKTPEKLCWKKLQTQIHCSAQQGCTLDPTFSQIIPFSVHKIKPKNAKNRCVSIHIWFLFHNIKGTFATLYTNIVEASLQHLHYNGVSPSHQFLPLIFLALLLFLIFPVTVLNVQFHQVFPSLDFIWNIWRTFKFEQSAFRSSAHTGLKNISFCTRLQAAKAPQK